MKKAFFMIATLLFGGELLAQVHLKNMGATLRISSDAQLLCPGSLTLAQGGAQTARVDIDGDLLLQGDLINDIEEPFIADDVPVRGTLSFVSPYHRQYIRNHRLTVTNLVLKNPYGLETENNLAIKGQLALKEGKLFVASDHRLEILQPAPSAISLFSNQNYIIGKLRRAVYAGNIHFPVGSASHGQFAQIAFSQAPGIDFLEVEFSDRPIMLSTPVEVDGARIYEFLDNGSWTISSQAEPLVPYSLKLRSQGQSNASELEGAHTFLTYSGLAWQALGRLNADESYGRGTDPILTVRDSLTTWGQFAVGKAGYILSVPEDPLIRTISISNNGSSTHTRTVLFSADSAFEYTVELRDMRGRDLIQLSRRSLPGLNRVDLDMLPYPKGLYSLVLRRKGELHELRVW